MTFEQLEAIRAKRIEIDATRERITDRVMAQAERQVEVARLSELTRQLLELEEAAESPPPAPNPEIAKLTPEAAAARAKAIRDRPEFWNHSKTDADGNPALSREKHQALVAEVVQLDARAGGAE